MNITGQATILKDDKGTYKIAILNKEIQENGEEQPIFMRINVGFKKGVEVKNKTKIDIKNGFLTFFRIATGNTYENGVPEYRKFPKIMVMDFEIVEEGTDEVYHSKEYSNLPSNNNANEFYSSDDDLPF